MQKSIMWDYIREEKNILNHLCKDESIQKVVANLKDMKTLYIVCHGSSFNAATAIAGFFTRMCGVRTYAFTPSNFIHNCASIEVEDVSHTWVMVISQTGTSRGVLEAGQMAKQKGFKVFALTNVENSPIDQLAHQTLYYHCGEEDSNAKTKGYSATLTLLMLTALHLGVQHHHIHESLQKQVFDELSASIDSLDQLQQNIVDWCKEHAYGKGMKEVYVVGNGMNFGTAMEGQLKLMETMCIPTMFNDIEEFSHGMHRALHEHSFVILLNTNIEQDLMDKTFHYLMDKKILVLNLSVHASENDEHTIALCNHKHTQSILLMTYVIQILSVFVPEVNGLDPNREANNDYTDWVATRVA